MKTAYWPKILMSISLCVGAPGLIASENNDLEAIGAAKEYLDAFKIYEDSLRSRKVELHDKTQREIVYSSEVKDQKLNEQRLKQLDEGIRKYNNSLTSASSSPNNPYIMLNLGKFLTEKASILRSKSNPQADAVFQNAVEVFKEISNRYPDFEFKNEADYQRAIVLESQGKPAMAQTIWKSLSKSRIKDRIVLHANLAAGDYEFSKGNYESSLGYFEQAESLLDTVSSENTQIDSLRVLYRKAWAAYKTNDLDKTIATAKRVLSPDLSMRATRQSQNIIKDAADLIGLSYYEINQIQKFKNTLRLPELQEHSAKIALTAMKRYASSNDFSRVAEIGNFCADFLGPQEDLPELLALSAQANARQKQLDSRISNLESLANLLPESSLWRAKNRDQNAAIQNMEILAFAATKTVADYHYESGITSQSKRSFSRANSFYENLLQFKPSDPNANTWRLRKANALIQLGESENAIEKLDELVTLRRVNEGDLSVAMYQSTVAHEKKWRSLMEQAVQRSQNPTKDPAVLTALKGLEKAVISYSDKFPGQSKSLDLLLVAASANRDMLLFDQAKIFWKRSLLAPGSVVQRSVAIRGLVYAELRTGLPKDVIKLTTEFLALESLPSSGSDLEQELLGVLASSAKIESERLSQEGKSEPAGEILYTIAKEFPRVPDQETLLRDGSYLIAIGSNWKQAELNAEDYIKSGKKAHWGDMMYLKARAEEYQLKFPESIDSYISLGSVEPGHSRSKSSLERAEQLAIAEENYFKASQAQQLLSEMLPNRPAKIKALRTAYDHSVKGLDYVTAAKCIDKLTKVSNKPEDRFLTNFLRHKLVYLTGDQTSAIDDLDTLEKQLERAKTSIGDQYKLLSSDINMFIAEDTIQKFKDKKIQSNSDISEVVTEKSRLFDQAVSRLDKVASLDHPKTSPKARYLIATNARDFADELSGIPLRSNESLTLKSHNRFGQNVKRLQELSKRYLANNILARQRSPQTYSQNDWIRMSAALLAQQGDKSFDGTDISARDMTTQSTFIDAPLQWSH